MIKVLQPKERRIRVVTNLRGRSRYIPSPNYLGSAIAAATIAKDDFFTDSAPLDQCIIHFHYLLRKEINQDYVSNAFDYYDYEYSTYGKMQFYGRLFMAHKDRPLTFNSWCTFRKDFSGLTFGSSNIAYRMPALNPIDGYIHFMPEFDNGDWGFGFMFLTKQEKDQCITRVNESSFGNILSVS
jgi:hypothetical protein